MTAPDWLLGRDTRVGPCSCCGRRRRGDFVARTIDAGASVLRRGLDADDIAAKRGLLQCLDARVKVVVFGALLVAAAMLHQLALIVALYLATTVLAVCSRVPLRRFVARVWCFVPIFSAIVVVPALFNIVTPGDVVVPFGTWFGLRLGVTAQGVVTASTIVARVATSISLVVLLTLTTRWTVLLGSLRALFVPTAFVLVLGLTYRYLLTLLACVHDMYLARKARSGREGDVRHGRRFVASSAASLFGKALGISDEVHQAMVARGYSGRVIERRGARPRLADVLLGAAGCAVALSLLGVDRVVVH